jgi:electron transport protein HydN
MSTVQSLFVQGDPAKCTGCRACEVACFVQHAYTGAAAKKTKTVGSVAAPVVPNLFVVRREKAGGVPALSMPVQCHHCEDAPCVKACLPCALSRVDGAVTVDPRRCIGCRNCALACPFGAIEVCAADSAEKIAAFYGKDALQTGNGSVKHIFKCDLCPGRDGGPACVAACPNEALRLVDTASEVTAKRVNALESAPQSESLNKAAAAAHGGEV